MGEGNGNPLQYSCLEYPMDGGAWRAAVHGMAKTSIRQMSMQVSGGSAGEYQADEQAGVERLRWRVRSESTRVNSSHNA